MNRLPCRPVYAQIALVVVLGLVGLSIVVDAPAAQAAPNFAGGVVVLAVVGLLARDEPLGRVRSLALVSLFFVGGLGLWFVGLTDFGLADRVLPLEIATHVALLVGLALFIFDEGPDAQ